MPGKITTRLRSNVIGSSSRRAALACCLTAGLLLSLASAAGAATFSNTAPITIPSQGAATPYPSQIAVSGLTGATTDVNVTLNGFSHTFPGDVAIVLVPPRGTSILLMNAAGTANTSGVNLTFDGPAAAFLPASGALATGTYKPTAQSLGGASFPAPGPGTTFCNPGPVAGGTACAATAGGDALAGALNGFNPNGTWRLYVFDAFNGDAGQIAGGWSLDITAPAGAETSLVVGKAGTGTGTVTSDVSGVGNGIKCGVDCAEAYAANTPVTLIAVPAANSNLASWTGCDSMTATTCTVNVNAAKNVTATFNLNPPQTLNVTKMGTAAALGVVTSSPAGINCGATCSTSPPGGTSVVLTASPPVGSVFAGFTGCDSMTATTCTVAVTATKNVTATFNSVPIRTLTVGTNGTGTGIVTGPGIACGADCTEPYNDGTSVVLVASPSVAGSRFTGWTGCDSVATNTCTVNMTTDRGVSANFTQGNTPLSKPTASATPTAGAADTSAPGVSSYGVTNSPFVVGGGSTPTFGFAAAKKHKKGTTFRYTLSEAATVTITISQRRAGRRKGIRCVAPRRSLRKKAKCTRITRKGTLTRISHQGANSVAFSGRIGSKALSPGSYSATITATDAAKNTSRPKTISFTIVKR